MAKQMYSQQGAGQQNYGGYDQQSNSQSRPEDDVMDADFTEK